MFMKFLLKMAMKFCQIVFFQPWQSQVVQRFEEEKHRVESYLHPSTLAPLIKKVEDVRIRDQFEAIYTEAKTLLHDEKYSDFALLFKLVGRVPNAIVALKKIVEDNFRLKAIESIKLISATAINACGNFINNNTVTEADETTRKVPELVARYGDILLRKGKMLAKRV
ncbi:unnamed protein product [Rotaria sp. Silwood1]|nr:unnamed protein product [Rotaria sp. Silwood1]